MSLLDDLEIDGLEIIKRETERKLVEKRQDQKVSLSSAGKQYKKQWAFYASIVFFPFINLLFCFKLNYLGFLILLYEAFYICQYESKLQSFFLKNDTKNKMINSPQFQAYWWSECGISKAVFLSLTNGFDEISWDDSWSNIRLRTIFLSSFNIIFFCITPLSSIVY